MRVQFVLHEVWIGLRRNLTMTMALVVVVAISLSLLGTGLLFVKEVNNTRTSWQGKVQLSVYLCTKVSSSPQCTKNGAATPGELASIQQTLQRMPQVTSVTYVSQATAYQQFKSEFPSMVNSVTPNEIPDSFEVKLKNTQTDTPIVDQTINGAPGVDQIVDNSAILLVANTIRLSAFNRRRETSIMRLVGASNFYVQLPFLVEGVIAGLFGWLIAAGLLIAVKALGLDTLQQYFPYNVTLSATDLVQVIVLAMVMGVALCGATSFVTLRRYLRA